MAKCLAASGTFETVNGYDKDHGKVFAFSQSGLKGAVGASSAEEVFLGSNVVVLSLVNQAQIESVLFDDSGNPKPFLKKETAVIQTSTVSPSYAEHAGARLASKGVLFLDAPVSGGPRRAGDGALVVMASGSEEAFGAADPVLKVLTANVKASGVLHKIGSHPGQGSTAKMAHQLLAGVHICTAAEALNLAKQSGLDPAQLYDIVTAAAGNSWMFSDRGKRMLQKEPDVLSALSIFIKDLGIVSEEADRQSVPVPLAARALQTFRSAQQSGWGALDDSQVIRVYESKLTGHQESSEGLPPGKEFVEVADEPSHLTVFKNEFTTVLKVSFPPGVTTWMHRHSEDSLYFFLVEPELHVLNELLGCAPVEDKMEFGEVRFGTHRGTPLVHKITNKTTQQMLCIDAEVTKSPPMVRGEKPLEAPFHELVKTRDRCRVYRVLLKPGESFQTVYDFFSLMVVKERGEIEVSKGKDGFLKMKQSWKRGEVEWREPASEWRQENIGQGTFEAFVAEWR
uniref:Uncharacterized protein n=1 Tax=Chromera velia CCMP2878 TaxID=1169474 RepID=A0A0G4FAB1_9ALVE|eukprot:Cvel_16016.t1-p1 / transcript=Cvel_16016.t1 / gene=Cvel_16016 / organism=Chromera_velia_CCMP2878 / gene_product=Uncharacterized oxidoreductase YgbJ, putative / transcript_product=Uncharacterized oxidoreductase YgbJ, putative / location=Cvel_scaffold1215:28587-32577(+) / protein_length=509 / sequence_SO=supercontig / SO=protein_coding / is_pseudo=false